MASKRRRRSSSPRSRQITRSGARTARAVLRPVEDVAQRARSVRSRTMGGAKALRAAALTRASSMTRGLSETFDENADMLQLLGEGAPSISSSALLELLDEFLAVERGGAELYAQARDRSTHPEIESGLDSFLRQTLRHAELLQFAIRELGGNPDRTGPRGRIQEQRAQAFLRLDVPKNLREYADIESLWLAEMKDQADWVFLRGLIPFIKDSYAQAIVRDIVDQVHEEEDEHRAWAKQMMNRLAVESIGRGVKRRAVKGRSASGRAARRKAA